MVTYPDAYYSRFDPTKQFEQHLFRAGFVLQSAEVNEIQLNIQNRVKGIADVLFRDGAVMSDCAIVVNPTTGVTTLGAGTIYLRGAVRALIAATITIPVSGTVQVGAFLQDSVVTEIDDPTLRDPAVAVRNYNEPGAARLKTVPVWGRAGDGTPGDFYPVYTVQDGVPISQQPPPAIDAIALEISRYDREATGGYYISSGLSVIKLADDGNGNQVYTIAEGVARVNGVEVIIPHALRALYPAVPDLKSVLAEPHVAAGGTERVNLVHGPINNIDQVLINAQKIVTISHGAFTGAIDPLPDSPILSIIASNQGGTWNGSGFVGGTTFNQGADYRLTGDSVDWTPTGAEPAPGSTYQVVYRYISSITGTSIDATGLTVTGAVAGTITQVSYHWKRPRQDLLCIDGTGTVTFVKGVADDNVPIGPPTPDGLLEIASIFQTWDATRLVTNDGVRIMPTAQIVGMQTQLNTLFNAVSLLELTMAGNASDPASKKGIFVDNFLDDTKRDAGLAQTASIYAGILTLSMANVTISFCPLANDTTLPLNTAATAPVIQQLLKTFCYKVNPYQAYTPFPAAARLDPACDFWTDTVTTWASPITERFCEHQKVIDGHGGWEWWEPLEKVGKSTKVLVSTDTDLISKTTAPAEFLRQITIKFTLSGMGPGEILSSVVFDGVTVAYTA